MAATKQKTKRQIRPHEWWHVPLHPITGFGGKEVRKKIKDVGEWGEKLKEPKYNTLI